MEKILLGILLLFCGAQRISACAGGDDYDMGFYNLFMQELISSPQYYPFLLTDAPGYYTSFDTTRVQNENIKEWQTFLKLNYEDAYYLVFKASEENVRNLIGGKPCSDSRLNFATPSFVSQNKQALLYLAYAKYLEPYMSITDANDWGYVEPNAKKVEDLDYNKVIKVLTRSWKAETNPELKLRYGYQLVRMAHYNHKFTEAIDFFDTYVKSLNFKPTMYYYALDQKAGAERGLGNMEKANFDFFEVFTHTNDLKESSFQSMRFSDTDYEMLFNSAKTDNEKSNLYLMLGYLDYNNPLESCAKIVAYSPDAIQAKILMARSIRQVEGSYLSYLDDYYYYSDEPRDLGDKHLPITPQKGDAKIFFDQVLNLSLQMANRADVNDKNYWYFTSAYLCFLNKDYVHAKIYLNKVESKTTFYAEQKKGLEPLIYISEQKSITPDVENTISSKYAYLFDGKDKFMSRHTEFVTDLLANRYFLQKDYGKSFLMNNTLDDLLSNPQLDLLADIEAFYNKPNKTSFEKLIVNNFRQDITTNLNYVQQYIYEIRGRVHLFEGDLQAAMESFSKVNVKKDSTDDFDGYWGISNHVFGYNQIECFDCSEEDNMKLDYMDEFPFIQQSMNFKELTQNLIKLTEIAKGTDQKSAKANYLLGNFFYNMTSMGYYSQLAQFGGYDGRSGGFYQPVDIYKSIYFKQYYYYSFTYHPNNVALPQQFLEKAYSLAKNNEMKARIVFALSKCEQEVYEQGNETGDVLIKDRKYFAEMQKYKGSDFYNEVKTNCKYFEYYVNNYCNK